MNSLNKSTSTSIKVYNSLKSFNKSTTRLLNNSIINNNNSGINSSKGSREIFTKINQNELGVRYTFGKVGKKALSPGLALLIPMVHTVMVFDTRPFSELISSPSLVTKDGFVVELNTLVKYKVVDPIKLSSETPDHEQSIKDIVQIQLTQFIPNTKFDQLINNRQVVNSDLLAIIKEKTESLGLELVSTDITDVIFSPETQSAISKKAEALLLKEARIISAQSELESSHIILEASKVLEQSPIAMRIREIEAMQDIAKEPSKSFIFAPSNLFDSITKNK